MEHLNRVKFAGIVTGEPKLINTSGGPLLSFRVKSSRDYIVKNTGNQGTTSCTMKITLWGALATQNSMIKEGDKVDLEGELKNNNYEDREGNKKWEVNINASSIHADISADPVYNAVPQVRDVAPDFDNNEEIPF